jgi:pimeloyl-ACP methyl ester carboxylesterase
MVFVKILMVGIFRLLDPPITEHQILHAHGLEATTEAGSNIAVYARVPSHSGPAKFPTIIQIYGLDGYRTEFTRKSTDHIVCGWASIAVEIPGTADCPALVNDPESPERLWSSILDWLEQQEWVDRKRIVVWGVSTGGYYALRIAHTHKDRIAAVVCQGAGCHYMFDPEWLEMSSHLDYPFE